MGLEDGAAESIWRAPDQTDAPLLPPSAKPAEPERYADGGDFPRPLALVERARHQRTLSQLSSGSLGEKP